ncbi:hypothetical protein [Sciscionella marina]|uniref:hypothetical protein n=1 Tax=Sciscionella marina TaxID=508770 RepID=UPI00036324AF|nr:hypothetical protein [Sciscionella marina]
MASGKPVTMPYLITGPLGRHQTVMPSLCASEYLLPPRSDEIEPAEPVLRNAGVGLRPCTKTALRFGGV